MSVLKVQWLQNLSFFRPKPLRNKTIFANFLFYVQTNGLNLTCFRCIETFKTRTEKFDSEEYRVLLVAEKYQTGFDQPFLHTMYVDKKLSGLQAVQTLTRLNRIAAGKEDTFVLDFRNTREEIHKAFKPYYELTEAEELTDPQHMYRLQAQIEEKQVIFENEVNDFCAVYFAPKRKESVHDHAKMNGVLDLAV